MSMKSLVMLGGAVVAVAAPAQTPAPAAKTPAAKTAPTKAAPARTAKPPVVRTAKSLDCSKQADAKGLHGQPRKSFMSSCKKS